MTPLVPIQNRRPGRRQFLRTAVAFILALLVAMPPARADAVVFTAEEQLDAARVKAALLGLAVTADVAARGIAALMNEATQDKAEPTTLPCFNVPAGSTKEEMQRQLQNAADKINRMHPDDLIHNIELYKAVGRSIDDSARRAFRNYIRRLLMEHYNNAAMVARMMTGLDAAHLLDLIAGGNNQYDLGEFSANRSIGPQWQSKLDSLLKAADEASKRGEPMNVRLVPC
jgi:hypothetical protein